ncbi:hypothetical protein Golob_010893 [Gossypium lobatum]|uniref:Uncharacterized protein n=1 Tax=Gossypium lobatum TaxID=34289 RepID=A0A7J8MN35_9ROSI|nr:hypothetical protein [Gossypium lobatum]
MSTSNNNEDDGASPTDGRTGGDDKEKFDFEEGDFTRTIVNRIPAIDFSDRSIPHGSTVVTGFYSTPTFPNGRCDLDLATRSTWLSVQRKKSGGDRGNDR